MRIDTCAGVLCHLQRIRTDVMHWFLQSGKGADQKVDGMFFTTTESVLAARRFCSGGVLYIDTTYNAFASGHHLISCISRTPTSTFPVGFAVVTNEKYEVYEWLVQVLDEVLESKPPDTVFTDRDKNLMAAIDAKWKTIQRLWCAWHLAKNLLENTGGGKGIFAPDRCQESVRVVNAVFDAPNAEAFDAAVEAFDKAFEGETRVLEYMKGLLAEKHRWVLHLRTRPDFGTKTTSVVEGNHTGVKNAISRRVTLPVAIQQLIKHIDSRLAIARKAAKSDVSTTCAGLNYHRVPKVSRFAMELVAEQCINHALEDVPCKGMFTKRFGLPCGHSYTRAEDPDRTCHAYWVTQWPTEGEVAAFDVKTAIKTKVQEVPCPFMYSQPSKKRMRARQRAYRVARKIFGSFKVSGAN